MESKRLELLQEICDEYQFKLYEHSFTRKNKFCLKGEGFYGFWDKIFNVNIKNQELRNITIKTSLVTIEFIDYDSYFRNVIEIKSNEEN